MNRQHEKRKPPEHLLNNHIKEYRLRKGYTLKEVAIEAGVDPSSVFYWENHTMGVSDLMKIRLCKLFKCSIDELFDWSE